jgi:hypothetical protein
MAGSGRVLSAHCPACRRTCPVRVVGLVVVGRRHLQLVQCADKTCELIWATRPAVTT